MSGALTGNVDEYEETTGGFVSECDACGGWGLATNRRTSDIAIGSPGGVITVWHVSRQTITRYAKLKISGAAGSENPAGITFDEAGNLYATDYPTAVVDEFDAATIASGGGSATRTYPLPGFASAYYLTNDGPNLIVDGWDDNYNFIVAELVIKGRNGTVKVLQSLGSLAGGDGFPGGLVMDRHHVLSVDNQYAGTILSFAKPWTGSPTSMLTWGYQPNDYTGIALDQYEDTMWAADIYTYGGATSAFGVANSYPLGSIGFSTAPSVEDEYVAITLSPVR